MGRASRRSIASRRREAQHPSGTSSLPNALRPLTYDQVRLLQVDNVVSDAATKDGRTLAGLGIAHPHAIGTVVPGYLERFRPRGQFSHYRG